MAEKQVALGLKNDVLLSCVCDVCCAMCVARRVGTSLRDSQAFVLRASSIPGAYRRAPPERFMEFEELGLLPPQRSGHEGRRARNSLPRLFIAATGMGQSRYVHGLIVLSAVEHFNSATASRTLWEQFSQLSHDGANSSIVTWSVSCAASFETPAHITQDQVVNFGLAFELKAAGERLVMDLIVNSINGKKLQRPVLAKVARARFQDRLGIVCHTNCVCM